MIKKILNVIVFAIISFSFYIQYAPQAQANPAVYNNLSKLIGLHESKNRAYLQRRIGVNPRRIPWCGAAIIYAVKKAGKKPVKGGLRALNWRNYGKGKRLSSARKGDVVIIRTKRGHHVGLYAGRKNGKVKLLGGNQSNRVKHSYYRISSIVAIRGN